jgi:hypothetical protein
LAEDAKSLRLKEMEGPNYYFHPGGLERRRKSTVEKIPALVRFVPVPLEHCAPRRLRPEEKQCETEKNVFVSRANP